MVDLYIDLGNEFYVIDNDSHVWQLLVNLVSGSETIITQEDFIELRRNMCRYHISKQHVAAVLNGAYKALAKNLPRHYDERYWDGYHGGAV